MFNFFNKPKAEITVVLCNWNNHQMLNRCIESLLDSITFNTEIKVVLNETSKESTNYLFDKKIDFVSLQTNYGCAAVDLLTPLINTEYVITINDDFLFPIGWQNDLVEIYKDKFPVVPCSSCVELENTFNPMVHLDNCGDILKEETLTLFRNNYVNGKYKRRNIYGYNHPSMFRTEDWRRVGGYSCGLPLDFFGPGGYCLDDYFNYRIWKLYNQQIDFVVSGNSCVYHHVSFSGKRLPPGIKNYDTNTKFVELTGMTVRHFREKLNWGKAI